ncbi:beta strand repeat-containing protein, partial [Megamonas funiformis]|uniref:beta strand repeat-containing protein n=1 Tax=Megamonas funiformis TaxID=437897 RepID=UPI0022E22EF7
MASNKKAQILAAVMCASSIFGSYTMVSAESSISGNNSSVVAGNGTITATAENGSNQTSKITLNGNSLSIDLAKNNNVYDGTFSLNSKYLNVNKYNGTVTVKGTTYTSDLANNGLTIKNSSSTLASLNNNGLNIYDGTNTKATATITKAGAITGTGLTVKAASDTIKPEGNYVESKVTTSGVADTIKQGGFTRATSNVTTNSIKDTIYTDSGTELSSINVFKNTAANGIENGKVSLTAKKIVTDNQTSTTTTSTLTLGGDNASLKVGNYGFTIDSNNNVLFSGKNASLTSTGLIVNGTGTSSIKSTNTNENSSTVGSYTKNDISYNGMTTTAKGGKYPSDSDNDNKTTSSVTYTGVRDTVYDDSGNIKSTSVVDTNGITLTSNRYDTGSKISSSLTIKGDSATLTSGTAYVKVDNTVGNVTLSGKNASLTSTGLTVNGTGTSSIKSTNATTEAYTKNDISYAGMTTTVRGGKNPSESDNVNKTTSAVTYTGVTDTVYDDGGNLKTKSSVTTSGITNTVYDVNTGKALANSSLTTSGISNTTTDLAMTGTNEGKKMSTALYQNSNGISASATKKDESGATIGTSTLTLGGDNASLKVGSYGFAVDSNNNVSINGKNATLSGSTFTLKDATNGKTVASLGASGLNINNADGIKVGGISNTGYLMANDGMNVTDKNSSWVTIGTSTMQKDITATTTTSYAGITNKIDTTLAGNKTYTSGTVVGPTSVTTTVQGSNTTDAISGNKNKTTSTVSATGVTDTVYNVKGNQVASSSVTTNGIVNTTTNLSIDGSTNNTMSTSIYQDKRGISASATKKDENGTVGTSTLTLAGNSASLKVGNYGFAVDSNNNASITGNNVSITGNNATLSGSTFTLKDGSNNTARLTATGLSFTDASGQPIGGVSSTGAITGTSL